MHASWEWFVVHYGAWEIWASAPWQAWTSPIINQVIIAVAQLFFAHRCYTLYGRSKLILGGLILGMLAAVALFTVVGLAVSVDPSNFALIRQWSQSAFMSLPDLCSFSQSGFDMFAAIPANCVNFATDLAITSLTLWKLMGHGGQTFSPNTNHVLRRLRNITVEAAVPPVVCALLSLASYLAVGSKNLIFTWFAIMTPRFYITSLMFTLNSRSSIRRTFNNPNEADEETLSTHFQFKHSSSSGRKRGRDDPRRTTVVFTTMSGAQCATNASMGVVDEHAAAAPGLESRRPTETDVDVDADAEADEEVKVYSDSLAGRSRSELQVDLDRWDKDIPLRLFSESIASLRRSDGRDSEPPPAVAVKLNQLGRQPSD
ncbi:hypothetical protein FRB90_003987 [Tulasnella sp. 427]|nr:hypothetical protein FRB90_003987 [Tulasnella sp. 427]